MKNNIIFKFIAILLCAASLLGAIGGVAGVIVMAEGDLYSKTAEQVRQERVAQNTLNYAEILAQLYTSAELGGCSQEMLTSRDNTFWFGNQYPNYGYRILDAEGNVLSTYNEHLKDTASNFSYPSSGVYLHLVSTETQTEINERELLEQREASHSNLNSGEVPDEGICIDHIELLDVNGNLIYNAYRANEHEFVSISYGSDGEAYQSTQDASDAGYLFYGEHSQLTYSSFLHDAGLFSTCEVGEIFCGNEETGFTYRLYDPNGIGIISTNNNKLQLFLNTASPSPAAALDGSTIPAGGIFIDQVRFKDEYGNTFYEATVDIGHHQASSTFFHPVTDGGYNFVYNTNHVGFLFPNSNGDLIYQSFLDESELPDFPATPVYGCEFVNDTENFSLRTFGENMGTLTFENGMIRFTATAAAPVALAEPIPEATAAAETIPETTAVPATTEALIPVEETSVPVETVPQQAPISTEPSVETSIPVETSETIPSSASAVPDETVVEAVAEATAAAEAAEATEAAELTEATVPPTVAATLPPETIPAETLPPETVPEVTEPVLINGKPLEDYQINSERYWDSEAQDWITAKYVYVPMPELTVELYVDETSMRDAAAYYLLELLRQYSDYLLPLIGGCLLIFAIFAVYLCTAAGRKPKTDIVRAGGLNRIPLDLYFFAACFAVTGCIALGCYCVQYLIGLDVLMACASAVGMFFLASLIFVAFCFAFVAQVKTPDGFWYRNTLLGHIMRLTAKFAVWLEIYLANRTFPFLKKLFKWLWTFTCKTAVWCYHTFENSLRWLGSKLGKLFQWISHKLKRFFSLLPLTWQWLVTGFFVVLILIVGIDAFKDGHNDLLFPVVLLVTFGVLFYAAHSFGILAEGVKRMSKGDLDTKVEDKLLVGCFEEFSSDLNDLADVAVIAAQKQLKSERMKTELITNVSHDIKTPLTSIINYVDLLQKPHTEEDAQQYLEVLDRQSQRLKKLIDDLMDMSKANTGNMQVDITKVDAVESVNQALGEFADKLDRAHLIPVFRHDDPQVPMMADGKLVWRVMSNILSNAVKYAMPGTRLYVDLMTLEGKVIISLKNISREELNIDADELMERFVRGDDSRNTEGSGLGLNIAKSLMELQKGQLQLLVDGDLFKVTLIFPGA